jgi:guanine deaminase
MKSVLKGNIIYTKERSRFEVFEHSYIVIDEGCVEGIYEALPQEWAFLEVKDYGKAIIIPSLIDLHIHAPQYMQIGLGLNLELIDWLDQYTFMLESRFADVNYGKKVYPHFVESLYQHGTLRACIFATIHDESTRVLVEALEDRGLSAFVGKVNMDRNAPPSLMQAAEQSLRETREFIEDHINGKLVKPIITPRFAPSCSEALMNGLGFLSSLIWLKTGLKWNGSDLCFRIVTITAMYMFGQGSMVPKRH